MRGFPLLSPARNLIHVSDYWALSEVPVATPIHDKIPRCEETQNLKKCKKLRTKPRTMHEKVGIIGSGPHSQFIKMHHQDPAW